MQPTPRNTLLATIALACLTTTCHANPTTIRIRFANGKTGKPLQLKSYERGTGSANRSKYKIERIEGDSMIVTFDDISTFSFRSVAFNPCDVSGKYQPPPKYDLQQIVQQGVVSPNYCGHAHAAPKPGELLIYSRHEHWWELTGRIAQGLLMCG